MTSNADLDALIDEITVDCYDEDEQLAGFENAFDEDGSLPQVPSRSIARPSR